MLSILYKFMPLSFYERSASILATKRPLVVCDIGGGVGNLAEAVARRGYVPRAYLLVDPEPRLVARAPRYPWLERIVGVAEALPLRSSACSIAVFFDSLHHVSDRDKALDESIRASYCILVDDVDPERPIGRLISIIEKLLGYPALFTARGILGGLLEKLGFEVRVWEESRLLPSFRLLACRKRID